MQTGTGHRFFSTARDAFAALGCPVHLHPKDDTARIAAARRDGYSLFYVSDMRHPRTLDVRPVGIGPFYRMERARYRADFRMTRMPYDPREVPGDKARSFFRIWERLATRPVPDPPFRDHVLVALQGRLLSHRRGQSMSPLDMIRQTLAQERDRAIVLKLHPAEVYTRRERAALDAVLTDLRVHLFDGDLDEVLAPCAYVVTQNSTVALKGMLYRKPAVLFADCDFHHICPSLRRGMTPAEAFAAVRAAPPDVERYLYWFLQCHSINTSRDWAGAQIVEHARHFGWKI